MVCRELGQTLGTSSDAQDVERVRNDDDLYKDIFQLTCDRPIQGNVKAQTRWISRLLNQIPNLIQDRAMSAMKIHCGVRIALADRRLMLEFAKVLVQAVTRKREL